MSRQRLTPAEARIFRILLAIYDRDGRVTIRGICAEADRNLSTVQAKIDSMRRKGWIEPGLAHGSQAGALRPVTSATVSVPLLATVAT